MSKSTNINKLPDEIEDEFIMLGINDALLYYDPMQEIEDICNFSIPDETRIEYFNKYYKKHGDEVLDVINSILAKYNLTSATTVKRFLHKLCSLDISEMLKIHILKSMLKNYSDSDQEDTLRILSDLTKVMNVSSVCHWEVVMVLMEYPYFDTFHITRFVEYPYSSEFKYKCILGIDNGSEYKFLAMKTFLLTPDNDIYYRILSAQYIFVHHKTSDLSEVEHTLVRIAKDETVEYNRRADATDILLMHGHPEARNILDELASNYDYKPRSIFENAQNVHSKDIEQSVIEMIEWINEFNIDTNSQQVSFDDIYKELDSDKTHKALSRISMDQARYSKYNLTLSTVLVKLWTFIQSHESKDHLVKRLVEELVDMSDTCSSGFVARLVNTISGYCDKSIRISWKEQIIGNFVGRMNALMRDMSNDPIFRTSKLDDVVRLYMQYLKAGGKCVWKTVEEFKQYENIDLCIEHFVSEVVYEIGLAKQPYYMKRNYLLFFNTYMPIVREEMYNEFKSYMSDSDFDSYFSQAITSYGL